MPLTIKTIALGEWMTNCHVVHTDDSADCWLVDVGFAPQPLFDYVADNNLTVREILLTHAHIDHIAGLAEARDRFGDAPVRIHEAEHAFLTDPMLNLSAFLDVPFTTDPADGTLSHGETVTIGGAAFEVRHTPGHSPGSVSLIHAERDTAIVGDTLFAGSIGRTDFPTSNGPQLIESIRDELLSLPDDMQILPGHGPASTIGRERATNPFLV